MIIIHIHTELMRTRIPIWVWIHAMEDFMWDADMLWDAFLIPHSSPIQRAVRMVVWWLQDHQTTVPNHVFSPDGVVRPFLVGTVKYEFSKTKKHFLVFENSYFVFFAYQTYRSSDTNTSFF